MEQEVSTQPGKSPRGPAGSAGTLPGSLSPVRNDWFLQRETIDLPGAEQFRARQQLRQRVALGLLVGLCVLGTLALLRATGQNGLADDHVPTKFTPPPLFQGWGNPAVALVLSGQQYGYLQPCGCSHPQYGGLTRRYNFVKELRKKNWPVVALDLGDIAPRISNPQLNLKYSTSMKALQAIGYAGVGVGATEMSMPLMDAIAEHRLNNPTPKLLAATLVDPPNAGAQDRSKTNQFIKDHVDAVQVIQQGKGPAVGIFCLIGPDVSGKINDPHLSFGDNGQILKACLAKFKVDKVQIVVLLYQGGFDLAKKVAEYAAALRKQDPTLPALDVVLCSSLEEEPPGVPDPVNGTPTQIIRIGHKGRYVGVVGAFATGRKEMPHQFKYQLVNIGPQYETPAGKETGHPIMALMEDYAREVKAANYITKYPRVPHPVQIAFPNAKYVGSQRCEGCHPEAFKIWSDSGHSHAFATLEKVKHPPLRQFDAECVVCHVVGFNQPTGYADALQANDNKMIERLKDVGCESCHGPGSEHVKAGNARDPEIHKVMNPWKATGEELDPKTDATRKQQLRDIRMGHINKFCQKCHDIDNDVHWNFEKKWPKVVHMSPARQNAAAPAPASPPEVPLNVPEPVNVPAAQPQPQVNPPQANPQPMPPQQGSSGILKYLNPFRILKKN